MDGRIQIRASFTEKTKWMILFRGIMTRKLVRPRGYKTNEEREELQIMESMELSPTPRVHVRKLVSFLPA